MYKSNISPLNPNKEKYSNNYQYTNNHINHPNQFNPNSNYPQNNYQYLTKNIGIAQQGNVTNARNQFQNPTQNYSALNPLSPNISKNIPMSPTAKIKMFSGTLNLNKKNSISNTQVVGIVNQNNDKQISSGHQNVLYKQNNIKNNPGRHPIFDVTDSIDLKCDEVLQEQDIKIKLTPISKNQEISKKSKFPILNFDDQDLKCDEILEIEDAKHVTQNSSLRNMKFNNQFTQRPNDLIKKTSGFHEIQNNFNTRNVSLKVETPQIIGEKSYGQKQEAQHHQYNQLTPTNNAEKKKAFLLPTENKKIIENDQHNNSKSQNSYTNSYQPHQKSKSFTNIISKPKQQQLLQNQESEESATENLSQLTNKKISGDQLQKIFTRMKNSLQSYKLKYDELFEKQKFLQKENVELRKICGKNSINK